MNKIVICGRLTKDPELRTTNNGTEVCGFTVAVDRRIKKNSEKETDFIDCTAWEKTGVFVNTYFHKGDGITVEGRMESRKWVDNDGKNRVAWGVTCDNVEFSLVRSKPQETGTAAENSEAQKSSKNFVDIEPLSDEDMPF